ncbi:MAG: hypothetical protein A3H01_00580 [Candidatus Wildermuthbacteria bacterium RIFCSPLOWO2_12_FULL_40_9]|uniref:Acylneuraminate cytidylyltransferase n=1 Tax=Candidatus Wildermuthbacteria bacterium RIFCSPLOWO2_12_FULL_40_9 TaxID=1802467 RepID=A0A1G2RWR1_9BACT|nr:MAG: hypothetical protein A3H01_00580 [Candidatus Wildermuthbacteria bacterium RIFCSPLOWO2_12_FULL_40_9]
MYFRKEANVINPTIFGVIPARGGSRGVPNKNLRELYSKPLINYIVEAALGTKAIHRVYVSTDSEQIAARASVIGAQIILHPSKLSTDDAPTFGVIRYALSSFRQSGYSPSVVVTMRPTSPLCLSSDIEAGG